MTVPVQRQHRNHVQRKMAIAFTLPEILVVVGVIAVLIAVLLPALSGALRTGYMANSQSNMKQIATWMTMYSSENREFIVPSQFDYSAVALPPQNYPVKVRSNSNLGTNRYKGTWTDVLWTYFKLGSRQADANDVERYVFDSPDKEAYDANATYNSNVLRAAAPNSRDTRVGGGVFGTGALPFGNGASESGLPGFFAANNFFNTTGTSGKWYVNSQIKAPERSMYLVDSFAGETIEPIDAPYATDPAIEPPTLQVDFRYSGACLMLFLDGHSDPQISWNDLTDLQTNRKIKVQNLDRN